LSRYGPRLGNARTSGVLAFDFFGGIPGFQTGQVMGLPRLLVAYARIEGERTALQAGQDHMLLAPRDPSSLASFSFPLLFRSGNLYLRVPHVRVERKLTSHLQASAGIVAPIGGDVPADDYRFVPPPLGGERSRRPGLQAHVAFSTGEADAPRHAGLGLSGHYGWERRNGELAASWATAVDAGFSRDRIGLAGEAFVGKNLDAFGGAIGQDRRGAGGWAEVQIFPTDRLTLNAGGGVDEIRGSDALLASRRRNRTLYGNAIFSLTPEIQTSLEYRWQSTAPGQGSPRENHHVDWVFLYKF
jgi:hypothetical protein